ncbi:MAG: hypothetical protein CMN05_01860 [Roseibacillus sp.]|jgi:hypothetical protein|nr:hypothetical protein [Roseibacillus sp.]MCP4731852.1 hypothetical protein [Roseibacillus sp.]MDP7656222.1 hypothetical protein [Roseibacillus sp.]|tara:strand:- start:15098 stop:15349 length:252 start_codon:yes stop_codon:yes gene_type:complete
MVAIREVSPGHAGKKSKSLKTPRIPRLTVMERAHQRLARVWFEVRDKKIDQDGDRDKEKEARVPGAIEDVACRQQHAILAAVG